MSVVSQRVGKMPSVASVLCGDLGARSQGACHEACDNTSNGIMTAPPKGSLFKNRSKDEKLWCVFSWQGNNDRHHRAQQSKILSFKLP